MATRKTDNNLQDSDLATARYGPKAVAKELSGLSTQSNLDKWSARARENSRNYYSTNGEPRKVRATGHGRKV